MKKQTLLLTVFLTFAMFAWSNSHISSEPHQKRVNEIELSPLIDGQELDSYGSFFSVGDDGFVIKWSSDGLGDHYQLTNEAIKMIACSPKDSLIAVYESDGGSVNKIGIWDWDTLERIQSIKFKDSILSMEFSSKGTYLIVGTASIDGVKFINPKTGKEINKLKDAPTLVNYIYTSPSEKSCALYSYTGSLYYYDMIKGTQRGKVPVMKDLTNTVLYNKSSYFAGILDNQIYILDANKGSIIETIDAKNPIILSTETDEDLYYLDYDGRYTYTLYMIESQDKRTVSSPRIIKTIKGSRGSASRITYGVKDSDFVYLSNNEGSLFKTDIDPSTSISNFIEITENNYDQIYGMAPAEEDFYFLTKNYIYKSSYKTSVVQKIAETKGQKDITYYKDNKVILWSRFTKEPVSMLDLNTKEMTTLFTPTNHIQSLDINTKGDKSYIVEVEGYSSVNLYDFETNSIKNYYTGTGVQDAILTHNGKIYVAKSSYERSPYPMLAIDMETLETVPVKKIRGNVVFSLSTDGTIIYANKIVEEDGELKTTVFSYHTLTDKAKDLLRFSNEDDEAFTYLNGDNLYTNIGKNMVYRYNLNTRRTAKYNRSASMPQSVCQNGDTVVILNYNGSISWTSPTIENIVADWYFTKDEKWREFSN